jgi:hypothetical protein
MSAFGGKADSDQPPLTKLDFMLFMVYWHRAGDVSQAKTEADCQKAGGMWEMNMCMEKKQ